MVTPLIIGALAFSLGPAPRAGMPTMLDSPRSVPLTIRGVPDSGGACILLPFVDFKGTGLQSGEVMLQELEDGSEANTQLILNGDGTLSHGDTDGPPPLDVCGLWQCGESSFQMTLVRTFTNSKAIDVKGDDALNYSVTRVYLGSFDPASSGVKAVEGRIELFLDDGATPSGVLGNEDSPAIGYFVLDSNTKQELEGA